MGNSLGFYVVQYLLFVFNVVFLIAGLNLMGLSVWALLDKDYLAVFIKTRLFTAGALLLLCVSALTIIISFFGCLGAIKGIRWILTLFFLSLFLVLAAILAGVIFMFLYRHSLSHQLEFVMKSSMRNNYMYKPQNSSATAIRDTWDWMQQTLQCCGVGGNGSYEWQSSSWFLDARRHSDDQIDETPKVPTSCCVPTEDPGYLVDDDNATFVNHDKCLGIGRYAHFGGPPLTQIVTKNENEGLYVIGCHRKIISSIADPKYLISIVAIVVGLILLLVIGMGLSCNMCRRLEEEDELAFLDESSTKVHRSLSHY